MRVSVVLPAFNEEKLLPAALAAVKAASSAFTARGWEWECVVCDNNSTDGTSAVARAAGATVVFEPVNQIGRARDAGARAATGEWLVFIDADSTPSAELFASIATRSYPSVPYPAFIRHVLRSGIILWYGMLSLSS